MSVKDCKDLPLELDSVVLTGKRGLRNIVLTNTTAGSYSTIFNSGAFTLAVESDSNSGVGPSAIALLANDSVGAQTIPLYLTGDGVAITGTLNINGVPYVPAPAPATITTIPAPVAGAGIASGVLHLAYQSAVYPAGNYIVNVSTDVFSTDHAAGILFSDGVIELRDNTTITTAVYSNFSEGGGLAIPTTWAYGANLTLLWTSTGVNLFQVYTEFTLTGAGTYQILGGGIVQVVKIG
jgi:hypothetical protein